MGPHRIHLLTFISILGFLCFILCFVPISPSRAAADTSPFKAHLYRNAQGETLPYRLLMPPHYDPARAWPLLLFLHGAGECGDDNQKQLINFPTTLTTSENLARHPCFALVPQVAEDCKWVYMNWTGDRGGTAPAKPSRATRLTLDLVENLLREFNIDRTRIYVMGVSMGGHGVWDILWRRPSLFAAAIPICGGGDLSKAPRMHDIPIWAFHGAPDPIVPVERSRAMIAALKKAGAHPRYTEYPDVGHEAWIRAFADPKLFDWLFNQRRVKE